MVQIRVANPEDIVAAERVADEAFAALRHIYRPREAIAAGDASQLVRAVAEMNGAIVGTVSYATLADRLHFRALAIDRAHRHRGVARAIIEYLSDSAKDAQLRALSLYTIRQTGNVPIFERLGFQVVREEPAVWAVSPCGDELVEVYMERGVSLPLLRRRSNRVT